MIWLPKELDFYSVTYADDPDATCRHTWYATCMHARMMHRLQIDTTLTCFRLSDSRDSGEDMKECGRGQSERHAKSWGGGGPGKRKKEGPFLSLVSSRFFFCFVLFCFVLFFFMYALSRFSGRYFLGAWNIRKPRRVFRLPTSEAGA